MSQEHGRLGSAQVRWNDYLGTAAADDADALLNTRSLYEMAGLDRNRWMIAGIDLSMGSITDQVVVYAMDRGPDAALSADTGTVAVTAFHLGPSVQLDAFLREAFQRLSVRLMSSVVRDRNLHVTEHAQPVDTQR